MNLQVGFIGLGDLSSGFRLSCACATVQGLGFMAWGHNKFRAYGLGFRVLSSGFRVHICVLEDWAGGQLQGLRKGMCIPFVRTRMFCRL